MCQTFIAKVLQICKTLLTFALENNNEIVYVTISVANINKKCRICKQKE